MKNYLLLLLCVSCASTQLIRPGAPRSETKSEVVKETPKEYKVFTKENSEKIKQYCSKTNKYFKKYSWGDSKCSEYTWNHVRNSYWGNPIPWIVYGDESKIKTGEKVNTTLIMCGVHGDEITPIKFCYDVMEDLRHNPGLVNNHIVVIAPLVTPDSFFKSKPTRTNARGIDVNRNLPTKDWNKNAIHLWKTRYRSDKRRYPGKRAKSEQESIFQVNLINRYKPNKIISVHAPLTLLDYDGPAFTHSHGKSANQLLVQMSQKANRYKISNYPFFTGSLGNWAGNENGIPTYTLELPNTDWHKTDKYFSMFKMAIREAIEHRLEASDTKPKQFSQK